MLVLSSTAGDGTWFYMVGKQRDIKGILLRKAFQINKNVQLNIRGNTGMFSNNKMVMNYLPGSP